MSDPTIIIVLAAGVASFVYLQREGFIVKPGEKGGYDKKPVVMSALPKNTDLGGGWISTGKNDADGQMIVRQLQPDIMVQSTYGDGKGGFITDCDGIACLPNQQY